MTETPWWRTAVTYQIYIRSFADGDGDGIGDVAGLRDRLSHLADLGVDALWINPWYPSPLADGGYDVADYRDVDPRLGTLEQGEDLIAHAHDLGLKVLLDVVPNHTSDEHRWFVEAVQAGPGSTARERYIFRPGRGPEGAEPPNNWTSFFGGPAWTRITEPDGTPGEWYLHLFDVRQPDLDWRNPEVREDFLDTLRFWFDRGADGFRIDVAHALAKDELLPDLPEGALRDRGGDTHPYLDRADVHDVYRAWREVADAYDPPRTFVAEAWVDPPSRLARYVRPDELHTAFGFELVNARWTAASVRDAIDATRAAVAQVDAPPTWVLSNHDIVRHPSRFGRDQSQVTGHDLVHLEGLPLDIELGRRRARAALLLLLALPGGVYLYQGEELGLAEVEDLPEEALADPTWTRSGHTIRGRDGCRVPLPWEGDSAPYGFTSGDADPWLPQPDDWAAFTVAAQAGDPGSMLTLYREALGLRRAHEAFGEQWMEWLDSPEDTLVLRRPSGVVCTVNFGDDPLPLPEGEVLLASGPLEEAAVPTDTAVWIDTGA